MDASVILPAFEEQEYIEGALESLSNQDRDLEEIIVVDSHSQDRTDSIASRYASKVIQTGPGVLHARNVGAEAASGDILLWTDADRRYPPDWAHRLLRHFEPDNDVVAVSGTHDRDASTPFGLGERIIGETVGSTARLLSAGYYLDGGSSATRATTYHEAGGLREDRDGTELFRVWIEEEVRFATRLADHGRVLYDRTATCQHKPRRLRAMIDPTAETRYAQQVRSGERF